MNFRIILARLEERVKVSGPEDLALRKSSQFLSKGY